MALPSPMLHTLADGFFARNGTRRRRFRSTLLVSLVGPEMCGVWRVTGRGVGDESWSILMYSDRVLSRLITYKHQASREAVAVTRAASRR
jgi:hypothetical protein